MNTRITQDDKSGDSDCHVYHVDGRIDLQRCYKSKFSQRICHLKQVRHDVCRRKNGFLQLQLSEIKRNFPMREFKQKL